MVETVPIARAVVHHDGAVLVLQNADDDATPSARGRWEIPGGVVEAHDDHERAAVIREIREETGLAVEIERALERVSVDDGETVADCQYYLARADGRDVALSGEHTDFRWVSPEAFRDLDLVPYAKYSIPVVERVADRL